MKFIALLYRLYVQCWSQGRAKLRAFPRHLERENTQLSPSLTPTLGRFLEFLKPQRPLYHSRLPRVLATAKNSVGNLGFGINTAAVSVVNANNIGYGARSS